MRARARPIYWAQASVKSVPVLGQVLFSLELVYIGSGGWIDLSKAFGGFPSPSFFAVSLPSAIVLFAVMVAFQFLAFAIWSLAFVPWVPVRTQRALVRRLLSRGTAERFAQGLLRRVPWTHKL